MLQARSGIEDLEGLSISLEKTLEIDVLIAIANNLDDLKFILQGKGFLAVMNGNEPDKDQTFLGAKGKGNGGKPALFNLKDTAIL